MLESLLDRFLKGDRVALSRLLSLQSRSEQAEDILSRLPPSQKPSRIIAITGSGGVGKSTLAGKLIELLRGQGFTVAILACDPQSPVSGGALLGDRFRMPNHPDDGIFIRSLAAPSGKGSVANNLQGMLRLLEVFGFDVILIETVGAGQGDTAVRQLADVVVLVLQPETGDDLQWEKAGVLEVADIVVIHKADLPGAERAETQVRGALHLSAGPAVPVLRVSSRTGEGIEALWEAVAGCALRQEKGEPADHGLLRLAQETLATWFARALSNQQPELTQLLFQWQQGTIRKNEAILGLLNLFEKGTGVLEMKPESPTSRPGTR